MTTINSDFWGGNFVVGSRSPNEKAITRLLRRARKNRELMLTLNGVAPGSAALDTKKRVAHSTSELGGVRTMETYTYVNRNSAAADVTAIDAMLLTDSRIATPTNGAGDWDA